MNRSLPTAALAVAMGLSLAACQRDDAATSDTAATPADAGGQAADHASVATTDLEQLAERIVTQSAAVRDGDVVVITGRPHDAELMENIAVHAARVGAQPMILYSSDRLAKRLFFDVPAEFDSRPDELGMQMAGMADVFISLGNVTSESLFEGADPERLAARGKAGAVVGQAMMKNNVRRVEIGNNLYPTPWRAERFAMDLDALSKMFWDGVNLDYSSLQTRGEEVKAALAGGDEVHVTHPNGTDLRFRIGGRPVLVSDGVISEDDMKQGGAAVAVYLPAGEVYTTPVAGTAEGKIVDTGTWFRGKPVEGLTLTVEGGKVTAMTGSGPGYADMQAAYDAVDDERKNLFAFFDLGINPNISMPADSKAGNWVQAGTVTLGTGANDWAGGDNTVPFGSTIYLPGSTVTLDGKTIVENGALKL